jgi:hypothetical protein
MVGLETFLALSVAASMFIKISSKCYLIFQTINKH